MDITSASMKIIKTVLLFVVISLLSCSKHPSSLGAERIRISVGVRGAAQTKATGIVSNSSSTEAKVNTLQVFVFNGDDRDGYAAVNGSTSLDVECSAGIREVCAIVNGADLSSVTTKSSLLNCVASLSGEVDNFVMEGHTLQTLKVNAGITIEVGRLAARVVLRGIRNGMGSTVQADAFHLDAVYLVNAAGDVDFGHTDGYAVSTWYNCKGYETSNSLLNVTYDSINADVPHDSTYDTAHFLYSMPNGNDPLVGGAWSPRRSLLVVHATVAGAGMYYPIVLPVLESNKSYEINLLTITRPGNPLSDDMGEEKPVEGIQQGFEIKVVDWTTVLVSGTGETDGNVTI